MFIPIRKCYTTQRNVKIAALHLKYKFFADRVFNLRYMDYYGCGGPNSWPAPRTIHETSQMIINMFNGLVLFLPNKSYILT